MNNKIATCIILLLIVATCLLSACDDTTEKTSELDTPILDYDGVSQVVSWNVVDNATMYVAIVWNKSH